MEYFIIAKSNPLFIINFLQLNIIYTNWAIQVLLLKYFYYFDQRKYFIIKTINNNKFHLDLMLFHLIDQFKFTMLYNLNYHTFNINI